VVTFFVVNVTSVVPFGPGLISHISVSRASPGITGEVNLTPKNLSARGSLCATELMTARAAKPKVDRPWRITPPKPPALPILGSDGAC
jgi:hypothetical protein